MNWEPYFFGGGPGHLSKKVERAAEKLGATLVNHTEPRGEKRHWFEIQNRGSPFNENLQREVIETLTAKGLLPKEDT